MEKKRLKKSFVFNVPFEIMPIMPIPIKYFFPLLLLVTLILCRADIFFQKDFIRYKILISSTESAIMTIIDITFHVFNSYNGWGGGT